MLHLKSENSLCSEKCDNVLGFHTLFLARFLVSFSKIHFHGIIVFILYRIFDSEKLGLTFKKTE